MSPLCYRLASSPSARNSTPAKSSRSGPGSSTSATPAGTPWRSRRRGRDPDRAGKSEYEGRGKRYSSLLNSSLFPALERSRHPQHVLAHIAEDQVVGNGCHQEKACLPELPLDIVLDRHAVAAEGRHRGVRRF